MKDQIDIKPGGKVAVLIHGFPEPIYKDNPIYKYFDNQGYTIIAPYLFSPGFKLNQDAVVRHVKSELNGLTPNVIVGVSLGGLVAPALAKEFPMAKLILVGTGPYIKPKIKSMNGLLKIGKLPVFDYVYKAIEFIPTPLYAFFYKLFNHPKLNAAQKLELTRHIAKNWNCIQKISESEDREVIDFLTSVNNSLLLKSIKNKTLIFAADEDLLMPTVLSRKLNHLIKGSKLIVGKGKIHYTVFDETNYKDLNTFLSG